MRFVGVVGLGFLEESWGCSERVGYIARSRFGYAVVQKTDSWQ